MLFEGIKRALVLAPHTDDGELGCGGTISKLIEHGVEIHYAAFSPCRESLPEGSPDDLLEKELRAAVDVLGVKAEHIYMYDFDVRHFPQNRQAILEELIKLRANLNPDLVFIPATSDIHQDHEVISREGIRAFKRVNVLGYEMPWNNLNFSSTAVSVLGVSHLEKKVEACGAYKSQQHRDYMQAAYLKSLASTRGVQSGVQYAEMFEVVHLKF